MNHHSNRVRTAVQAVSLLATVSTALAVPAEAQAVTKLRNLREVSTGAQAPVVQDLSPDGAHLYVSWRGPLNDGQEGGLLVIDTATETVVGSLDVNAGGPANHGFTVDVLAAPSGGTVYLTVSKAGGSTITAGESRVEVLDVSDPTNPTRVTAWVSGLTNEYGDSDLAITPDGASLWVTSRGNDTVRVLDTATGGQSLVTVLDGPLGIDVRSDGSEAWVASRSTAEVTAIDTTTLATTTHATSLAANGSSVFVTLSADDSRAYVTSSADDRIAVVDTATGAEVGLIPTGCSTPREAGLSADGKALFLCCQSGDEVLVVDVELGSPTFHTIVHAIPAGESPTRGVAIQTTITNLAFYVPSNADGTIEVIGFPTASETLRFGVPPNAGTLALGAGGPPKLGTLWSPAVSGVPSSLDVVIVSTAPPVNAPTPFGTLLCNVPPPSQTFLQPAPGAPIPIAIPPDCELAGLTLCAQGAGVTFAPLTIALTNAIDLVLGV